MRSFAALKILSPDGTYYPVVNLPRDLVAIEEPIDHNVSFTLTHSKSSGRRLDLNIQMMVSD